ncbi:MAG: Threonine synthase [uncultured Thermomicrobiales bacterium]|uniref:Threonine synthase n=1 Tax=uncultured Thermomicrobiales bacterium TaxID=1645740 RepID=A0A6J4TI42_9BACT|nr:MAG: Threonine synthase [uncultured Thermomicrobiales bacterium]
MPSGAVVEERRGRYPSGTPSLGADAATLAAIRIRCMGCGTPHPANVAVTVCPRCGGLLDVEIPLDTRIRPEEIGQGLPSALRASGVWRYRALLPAIPDSAVVTRAEGNTPLYWDDRLAGYAGLTGGLGVKHEGHNPTASFKDRGMTVGVSHAKAVGARIVACASTGNTSASLASYAATAGIPALVLIPEGKISGGKLAQTIAYGARVVQVEGNFDQALTLLRELTAAYDAYLVNSVNPFRLQGQKTIVIELLEQLGWRVPDAIALPGGNLGNTSAFGMALADLLRVGLIDRLPKLVTVQAAGAAPFAPYFASGWQTYAAVSPETMATAIKIGNPASTPRARRAIEQTEGIVTTVSDDEIEDAKAIIDRVGIGCEPASAASLAGVKRLVREGVLGPDSRVVGVLTGHLLKDTEAVIGYHLRDRDGAARGQANRPLTVPARLDALERVLADALHG